MPGPTTSIALVEIYNHYVVETHITFDTEPFAVAQRIQWFNQFSEEGRYRLLVAEDGDEIRGYASSTVFKPRAAYNTSVETTIYLDPAHTGGCAGVPRRVGRPVSRGFHSADRAR